MRIAIDTNVLIGALTNPRGESARLVRAWREGRLEVVASEATVREAELVLGAPSGVRCGRRGRGEQAAGRPKPAPTFRGGSAAGH
jgi:hypothetical protein